MKSYLCSPGNYCFKEIHFILHTAFLLPSLK